MLINVDIIGLSRLDSRSSKAERRKSFLLFTINSDNNDTIFHAIAYSAWVATEMAWLAAEHCSD